MRSFGDRVLVLTFTYWYWDAAGVLMLTFTYRWLLVGVACVYLLVQRVLTGHRQWLPSSAVRLRVRWATSEVFVLRIWIAGSLFRKSNISSVVCCSHCAMSIGIHDHLSRLTFAIHIMQSIDLQQLGI